MSKYFFAMIAFTYSTQSLKLINPKYEEAAEIEEIETQGELDAETKQKTEPCSDLIKINELNTAQTDLDNRLKKVEDSIQDQPKSKGSFAKKLTALLGFMIAYHFYLKNSLSRQNALGEKVEKEMKNQDYESQIDDLNVELKLLKESINEVPNFQTSLRSLQSELRQLRENVINLEGHSMQSSLSQLKAEELSSSFGLLKQSTTSLQASLRSLQSELSQLREGVINLEGHSKQSSVNQLKAEELASSFELLKQSTTSLQASLASLQSELRQLREAVIPIDTRSKLSALAVDIHDNNFKEIEQQIELLKKQLIRIKESNTASPQASNSNSSPKANCESAQPDNTNAIPFFTAPQPQRSPEKPPAPYQSARTTGSTKSSSMYSY